MVAHTQTILLVEDNPADVRLTRDALKNMSGHSQLAVAKDGVDAMAFLHQKGLYAGADRPDLIFLDLNLPRKNGLEVLAEINSDLALRRIPVVILTTSRAEKDIVASYNLNANCYIVKPADPDEFFEVIRKLVQFWFAIVTRSPI